MAPRRRHASGARRVLVLALLCVVVAWLRLPTAASPSSSSSSSRDAASVVRVLAGSSFRAFSNRFRRQLRGAECLSFHEAGHWWRYEWCVGRYVRQFHNDSHAAQSIVLGRFASGSASASATTSASASGTTSATSKTVRIQRASPDDADAQRDPETRGYVATQRYSDGERCPSQENDNDNSRGSGMPRTVSITYRCCVLRTNETYIEAITEPSRCAYALSVCSPVACGLLQKDQYAFGASAHVSDEERRALLSTVKDMFYHAYHGYMDHAFPLDALLPLSCRGESFELGKIPMLTLIDTLDTLAIFEDRVEFQRAVALVTARASFDLDTEVSVFETTIRVLGGLLSAHLFAVEPTLALMAHGTYDNELLTLAVDLADRLLPAFNTTTGIPYGTVNLRHGVPRGETPIASTAGAGSLSMEFTMLSVLTGDARYATASRRAVRALFDRRSRLGLLGKHIDTASGEWTETASGPGSNSDSFYEYLWKMYATFNDRESLAMFDTVYASVLACNAHGDWLADVSMWTGCSHGSGVVFENLAAFWPGLQASLGHIDVAARSVNAFYRVWRDYGFVPEQFNVLTWKPVRGAGGGARYPLRPELIESTFYLHEATGDPSWLRAGAHFVHSLQKHTKTTCGYATVRDVETKTLEDNMPSFFLSETCKYLYLLFNTTHFVRNGSYVFTTEAHPFPVLSAARVERVLLPTTTESETATEAATTTTTTVSSTVSATATRHDRVCRRPAFWHAHGYDVDYEGTVVERTERCARPMSAKPSAHDVAAAAAQPATVNADDWLPLLEKQLRAQLAKLGNAKHSDGTDDDDGAFLQRALHLTDDGNVAGASDSLGQVKSVPTAELMAQLNEKLRTSRHQRQRETTDTPSDAERSAFRYVNGGPTLGVFRMEQTDALMRFTRQDTGEWLETTGVEDTRFTVLSWLPERTGFRGPHDHHDQQDQGATTTTHHDDDDDDDELPLLLPRHRVYDFANGRKHEALRRHCALRVDVTTVAIDHDAPASSNPYSSSSIPSSSKSSKSFAFSCASASFGAMPRDDGETLAFPAAPLVLAQPLDACVPLTASDATAAARLRGKIAVVTRGACFFETKVRNAAAAGAVGVVVVNNEDADRVMVMSGASDAAIDDDDNEEYEYAEDRGQSLRVPAIMVPRRAGEWLHRQLLKQATNAQRHVRGTIELVVQDRAQDVAAIHTYLDAVEALAQDGKDDKDDKDDKDEVAMQQRRQAVDALATHTHPRMEMGKGPLGRVKIFGPLWGIDLTPVSKPGSQEIQSWLLEIVEAPQTHAAARAVADESP